MTADDLQDRTFAFAVDAARLCRSFPRTTDGYVFARQLLKAATSVGANYRAARRGRSREEFVAKLGVVVEEADETHYWLTLAVTCELVPAERADALIGEARELLAIFVASRTTARERATKQQSPANQKPEPKNRT